MSSFLKIASALALSASAAVLVTGCMAQSGDESATDEATQADVAAQGSPVALPVQGYAQPVAQPSAAPSYVGQYGALPSQGTVAQAPITQGTVAQGGFPGIAGPILGGCALPILPFAGYCGPWGGGWFPGCSGLGGFGCGGFGLGGFGLGGFGGCW